MSPLLRPALVLAGLAAAFLIPSPLPAAPGDLDSTFGTGGKVTTALGGGSAYGNSVAVQSDGKIVVAGLAFNNSPDDIAVARYTATGALDTTFGGGTGKVITSIGGGSDRGLSVAVQADGKILVAGDAEGASDSDFALVRYTATGALDTTFGGGTGKVTTPIGSGHDVGRSIVLQGDGKILVAGYAFTGSNTDFALVRYTDTGALDATFGTGGMVTTGFDFSTDEARGVAVQGDGKIVVVGSAYNGGNRNFALVRYTDTGTLDTAFGTGGKVMTHVGSGHDEARSLVVQGDGKIIAAGSAINGSTRDFALVRFTDTGALDTTFGTGGKVITPVGSGHDDGRSVTVQANGKILVAGDFVNGTTSDFALVRYTDTGVLDTAFGGGTGKVTTAIGSGSDLGYGVAVQANGKIVVAGASENGSNANFALARYLGDAVVTPGAPTFLFDPTAQTAFVGASVTFEALALGDPAPTYQWMYGDSPIDGATGTTLRLDGVTLEDAGNYSVVATNTKGSTPSTSAALIVLQTSAPRIVQQPKDVRFRLGREASFTVSATGTPPLSYQWYNEFGSSIGGATTATLTFPSPSQNVGRYYVVVTNALGQKVQSRLAQLATFGKPLPVPRVKPESQSFSGTVTLQITCAEPAATIHYTTDGSLPDASSPVYDPASPPVLSETSIVSAVAVHFGARPQSPASAVKRYFKISDAAVGLGTLDNNRLLWDDALGSSADGSAAHDTDRYTFTNSRTQHVNISVSENAARGPLMLEVISPGGQTIGVGTSRRGAPIGFQSALPIPPGTYTVRVRLPEGLLKFSYWPYRLTISGGDQWAMLGIGMTAHHVGLRALRPADEVVAGKAAWVVSHGRASSPSAENIDSLARTLAAAEGDGTQVLLVDWETAAADNTPELTGLQGAKWIVPVADFVQRRLSALNITGAKLSLAGHSWGSYVVHQIGKQMTANGGSPKRLVALDPALVGGRAIKFSTAAQHSWAFFSSGFGNPKNAATAHDAFVLGVPLAMDNFAAHSAAVTSFSGLLRQHLENPGDTLAARFALDRIEPGHWIEEQVRAKYPEPSEFSAYRILPVQRPAGAKAKGYPFEAGLFIDEEAVVTELLP